MTMRYVTTFALVIIAVLSFPLDLFFRPLYIRAGASQWECVSSHDAGGLWTCIIQIKRNERLVRLPGSDTYQLLAGRASPPIDD